MTNINEYTSLHTPAYILEEKLLRRNLDLISGISRRTGVEFILAYKAFALWKSFPIFREYIQATTASSLNEARMANEIFGSKAHTFSPAYTDYDITAIAKASSHLTFNSLGQFKRLAATVRKANPDISLGLRINPGYSEVETLLYNPCAPGTRFGVRHNDLPETLPDEIEGLHCHNHCESSAEAFERSLAIIEEKFGKWLGKLKWINFGGGHLVTRKDYNTPLLEQTLSAFRRRYPNLHVIMEPGSAFAWQTGPLVSQVVDIVEDHGYRTAILNVSFTSHMPDCLEMPYYPQVRHAVHVDDRPNADGWVYRLGGCSCLSGDFMGAWQWEKPLQIGQNVIFEDMIHYTTVKTNMFNGVQHPDLMMLHEDGTLELLRRFTFEDYLQRMD